MAGEATLLLVEDDEAHVELVHEALATAQLVNPVDVARDGDEAIAYLEGVANQERPLPVFTLLDVHLPGRSGLDVLAWIRAQPRLHAMPVIMLTASEEDHDIDRAYELGANSYLTKPVGFTALVDVVRTVGLYWVVLNRPPSASRR